MRWIWPDITDERRAVSISRGGFWASLVVGALLLIPSPLGVLYALPFLAVAVGIRARQPGAAAAGLLCVGLLITRVVAAAGIPSIAGCLLLSLPYTFFCIRSLRALLRYHAIVSPELSLAGRLRMRWMLPPLFLILVLLPISFFVIPTGAMEDTLLIGDWIIVERVSAWSSRPPQRGDIIVFRYPMDVSRTYARRVVGIPGDRIRIRNKQVYRNGEKLDEPYIYHKTEYVDPYRDNFPGTPNTRISDAAQEMLEQHVVNGEVVVPPAHYFAMGDNRDSSLDSRYWGFVPGQNIIGKPLIIYWSYDPPTDWLVSDDEWEKFISQYSRARWDRILTWVN